MTQIIQYKTSSYNWCSLASLCKLQKYYFQYLDYLHVTASFPLAFLLYPDLSDIYKWFDRIIFPY